MIFRELLNRKTEDKKVSYDDALVLIKELEESGALPIEFRIKQGREFPDFTSKDTNFSQVFEVIDTYLAPYQYEQDPRLKGETSGRYRVWNHQDYNTHRVDLRQKFDNIFGKDKKGHIGRFIFKSEK